MPSRPVLRVVLVETVVGVAVLFCAVTVGAGSADCAVGGTVVAGATVDTAAGAPLGGAPVVEGAVVGGFPVSNGAVDGVVPAVEAGPLVAVGPVAPVVGGGESSLGAGAELLDSAEPSDGGGW
jgi:hypothetical protein